MAGEKKDYTPVTIMGIQIALFIKTMILMVEAAIAININKDLVMINYTMKFRRKLVSR